MPSIRSVSSTKDATPFWVLVRALLAVGAALCMTALAGPAAVRPAAADPVPAPNPADFACVFPTLPKGVTGSSGSTTNLSGPAVSALRGGAAQHGFSLDDGGLVVTPPHGGEAPVLSAHQAVCGAMNSTGGLSASATDGVAVGYGEVSVASRFFPALSGFPGSGGETSTYPTVSSFHDRLAWLVVVHTDPVSFSCPLERSPVQLTTRAGDHGYEVFVIDARSGTDALIYREGGPGGCTSGSRVPPTVGVAEESVSVPWTLAARDPGGYSGTISATVLPCDRIPDSVLVDRAGPNVVVEVTRPFGPPCGLPETIPIRLDAAVVTADLPAVIGHDPVGLTNLLSFHPPGVPPPTTTTTSPALVPVDASSSGQTVELTVGQVLTVQPLPGSQGFSLTSPAFSSDPSILGLLTSSPQPIVAEFRAWRAGSAEIVVPQSACVRPGSDQAPCNGPFVVHVLVH